jgi:hypothetical protein
VLAYFTLSYLQNKRKLVRVSEATFIKVEIFIVLKQLYTFAFLTDKPEFYTTKKPFDILANQVSLVTISINASLKV